MEDLPAPQQWTVLGILGFVLAGVTWLLQNVGSRLARVISWSSGRVVSISACSVARRWAISIEAATPFPETSPIMKNRSPSRLTM